jgi:transcription termination factor NusB
MSEPLTAERFDQFVELYTENHAAVVKRLDKIDTRLDAIEKMLWQGQRIAEIERRVIRLAELAGDASLAVPFNAPIGTAEPMKS